jgi:hypothetical protein
MFQAMGNAASSQGAPAPTRHPLVAEPALQPMGNAATSQGGPAQAPIEGQVARPSEEPLESTLQAKGNTGPLAPVAMLLDKSDLVANVLDRLDGRSIIRFVWCSRELMAPIRANERLWKRRGGSLQHFSLFLRCSLR